MSARFPWGLALVASAAGLVLYDMKKNQAPAQGTGTKPPAPGPSGPPIQKLPLPPLPFPGPTEVPIPGAPPVAIPVAPFTHKLLTSDLLLRPTGFAMIAGFASVAEFLAANPSISISDSDVTAFATDPGVYQTSVKSGDIDTPVWKKATPWVLGQAVKTKVDLGVGFIPSTPALPPGGVLPFVGNERGPKPFGGSGWGGSGVS